MTTLSRQEGRAGVRLSLPFPPSVHGLYRGGRWRGDISPAYKAWRDEAGYLLNRQNSTSLKGPVRIFIRLVPPDGRERDGDNYVKAVFDLLVSHGVIEADDSTTVRSHYVEWADDGPSCVVVIQSSDDDTWEQLDAVVARVMAGIPIPERGAA